MPKGILDPNAVSRCVAHRKDGERCKKAAIKGATVCRSHGGAAPQVVRSARERFNDLIDPMINIAHEIAKEAEEGKLSASDRIAFMKFVADRTGFIPGKSVNIDGPAPWEITLKGIIREVPAELAAGDVIDAEVIEDDEDPLERHEREEADRRRAAYDAAARDRARADLLQFSDRREAQRVGSAEPPQRQSMRSPWG